MLAEIPPTPTQFVDFPKSATGQLPKLPTCTYRNPPHLQIIQNLPLDSYVHVLAEILPSLWIFLNLPLDSYLHVLAEPPQFADFLKSATGQLPTCACRKSYHVQIFRNLPLDICRCMLAEILPSLQIFQNLPLDSYLHVLAEIPPQFADFPKSATGHLPKLSTCAYRNSPPVCRFSQICHWTVT